MGFISKVKGILFDEEEIELPEIKSETKKVEHKAKEDVIVEDINPIKEIKVPKDDFSDKESYKSESTFNFPIDFADTKEFEDLPDLVLKHEKEVKKVEHREVQNTTKDFSEFLNKREDKRKFKPTPIISPVYGILDQNYKKEDVVVKKEILRSPKELTIDEVRKRAFGGLEQDIENNLEKHHDTNKEKKHIDNNRVVEEPVDKLKTIGELIIEDDLNLELPSDVSINNQNSDNTINSTIDEDTPTNTIEDLYEDQENIEKKEEITTENDEINEDEADLFSLIDSMYEEKGE